MGTNTANLSDHVHAVGHVLTIDILRETGATYRQVDYWSRVGLLRYAGGHGSGSPRMFPIEEVDAARIITELSARGIAPTSTLSRQAADVARAGTGGTVYDGPISVLIEPRADQ